MQKNQNHDIEYTFLKTFDIEKYMVEFNVYAILEKEENDWIKTNYYIKNYYWWSFYFVHYLFNFHKL